MVSRDDLAREMRRISQRVDRESDAFANLFNRNERRERDDVFDDDIDEKAHDESAEEHVETRMTALAARLAFAREQRAKAQEKKAAEQARRRAMKQRSELSIPENLQSKPGRKGRMGLFEMQRTVYALPLAIVGLGGVFLAGFYGAAYLAGGSSQGDQSDARATNGAMITRLSRDQERFAGGDRVRDQQKSETSRGNTVLDGGPAVRARLQPEQPGKIAGLASPAKPVVDPTVPVRKVSNPPAKNLVRDLPGDQASAINILLQTGRRLETGGDIRGARAHYRKAAEQGASAAALALAKSFDPRSYRGKEVDYSDPKQARNWYEKWFLMATEKGEISPRIRYDRLLKGLGSS